MHIMIDLLGEDDVVITTDEKAKGKSKDELDLERKKALEDDLKKSTQVIVIEVENDKKPKLSLHNHTS